MPQFNSEWKFLSDFVKKNAFQAYEASNDAAKIFFVEVIVSDGFFASVRYASNEIGSKPITGVPIIQSPYHTTPIMPGDTGLLLNCHQNIGPLIEGRPTKKLLRSSYYVFLPLMKRSKFKGSPLKHEISSPTGQTKITIDDMGVVMKITTKFGADAAEINFNAKSSVKIVAPQIDITASSALKIDGGDVAVTSSSPMQIGELASILNDLCSALSGFKTLPTSPGAPAMPDPSFVADIANVQAAVGQAFK